jgi:hypothetical protein
MIDYLYISEPEPRSSGPILVCDADHNDVAEFFHNEHATVGQSYEVALSLAQRLADGPQEHLKAENDRLRAVLKTAINLIEADVAIDRFNGTQSSARQWVLDMYREFITHRAT